MIPAEPKRNRSDIRSRAVSFGFDEARAAEHIRNRHRTGIARPGPAHPIPAIQILALTDFAYSEGAVPVHFLKFLEK
jgi:hypothetical protein